MYVKLSKEGGVGKALFDWWQGLVDDKGSRAVLRRAATVTAITLTPAYQHLFCRLQQAGWKEAWPGQNDRLAVLAGLLAHVKEDSELALAQSMSAHDEGGDRPLVSELRFLRLLEAPDLDALFTGLRRALPLMKGKVNVLALAQDLINWNDQVKKNWAYTYNWPDKSST